MYFVCLNLQNTNKRRTDDENHAPRRRLNHKKTNKPKFWWNNHFIEKEKNEKRYKGVPLYLKKKKMKRCVKE